MGRERSVPGEDLHELMGSGERFMSCSEGWEETDKKRRDEQV